MEIINRIRSLSLPMAEMIYTMTAQYGRWGAYISNKEKYRIMTKIDEELIRNGVDKEQLEEAKRQWHLYVNIDYSLPIIDHLKGLGSDKIKLNPKDIQLINKIKEAKKELDQYAVIDDFRNLPIFMVNYINSNKLLTDNEKENIFKQFHEEFEDMKYYSIHRKFRRLEKWLEKKY